MENDEIFTAEFEGPENPFQKLQASLITLTTCDKGVPMKSVFFSLFAMIVAGGAQAQSLSPAALGQYFLNPGRDSQAIAQVAIERGQPVVYFSGGCSAALEVAAPQVWRAQCSMGSGAFQVQFVAKLQSVRGAYVLDFMVNDFSDPENSRGGTFRAYRK